MTKLKITQIGNSLGVILPKEMLSYLKVDKGDSLFVSEMPGGYAVTPHDPAFDEQMTLGREFMREYRETFKALAK